ncbi:MAG TPA: hypothetical protein VF133_14325 [Terriglobales bacterium]
MNSFSPVGTGLRLIARQPAIALAEIAWRWSFAVAAWMLGAAFLFEYLDSLPVTAVDRFLLAQPIFISRALHRIFQGTAIRFTEAAVVLLIALAIAWTVLASLGRVAVVNSMMEEFHVAAAGPRRNLRSVTALNVMRVALTVAAVVGVAGAALLSSSVWASAHVRAAEAARLLGLILFLVGVFWIALNWLLSVAAIFPVAEQQDALDAVGAVLRLLQLRTGPMVITGLLFAGMHVGLFIVAAGIGLSILTAAGALGGVAVVLLELLLIAAYSAVADFLYISRLAAYVSLLRPEEIATAEESPALESKLIPGSLRDLAGEESVE